MKIGKLDDVLITGDAGNCSAATAGQIYRLGGDYLLQIKGNLPTALAHCERLFSGESMPLPAAGKGNGRVSERAALAAAAMPCEINIPFARSVIKVERRTTCKGVQTSETCYYVTNRDVSGWTQEELLEMLSSHWKACESNTHWIRDAQYKEDKLLQRNPTALTNQILLINAAAFITNTLRKQKKTSTPVLRETFQKHPSKALAILMRPFNAAIPA